MLFRLCIPVLVGFLACCARPPNGVCLAPPPPASELMW